MTAQGDHFGRTRKRSLCPDYDTRNEKERKLAERLQFSPEIRLACQTTVAGNVKLRRLVLDAEDVELTSQIKSGATGGAAGQEKRVAILFADIRGFTTFSEALLPYDVIYVLNRYFHQMGKVINRHGGCIDNYMGDGIMALFGINDPTGAALQAVKAGLGMLEAVEHLRPYLQAIYTRCFEIGIGVHVGEVVVGSIGAEKKVTAIGDAVNFASRIEAANKVTGTHFLISEDTYNQVRERIRVGKSTRLSIPGKSGKYTLYEVNGLNEPELDKEVTMSDQATIQTSANGPYIVKGPIELLDPEGSPFVVDRPVIALCRCGGSNNKPFCDGTHAKVGFQAADKATR